MTCETFELGYEWLVNHLVMSSAPNHSLTDEEARDAISEHPTYVVEVDEEGWPVEGQNYPDNADPAEPDDTEDAAAGGTENAKVGKGGGNAKGGKGGKNKGGGRGRGSDYRGDRHSHDREHRVVPYNDRGSGRRQPQHPSNQPPMHLALEQARQDPRAQLSQAIKFVQAWILLCSAGFLLPK